MPPPRPSIAFYAPLKSPDHPVPSGDRLMARQLRAALGTDVDLVSELRSYLRDPQDATAAGAIEAKAEAELARISALWEKSGPPALWVSYHPYYKAPDLLGPELCARFGVAYVTVESSLSTRRNVGLWMQAQDRVRAGLAMAALNICITRRDQAGLQEACGTAATAMLSPFIDTAPFSCADPLPQSGRLICVAMMRAGDKMESYDFLASALQLIPDLPWRLSVIGDGEARAAVHTRFASMADRVDWLGSLGTEDIAKHLARAAIYVWPGCGEAYGLAYLEAQAAGLPVVAQRVAGVPEVVTHDQSGLLTDAGDLPSYAAAIQRLLTCDSIRHEMAQKARAHVLEHHSQLSAEARLSKLLAPILGATQ